MAKRKTPAPKAEEPKRGRPTTYTEEAATEICDRLARGEPLAVICRDDHMPARSTVYDWSDADAAFSRRIARAREDGFDEIAIECLAIADETSNDSKVVGSEAGPGHLVPNTEWISRSKLRVETRLKLLAKWDPKRYGDKLAIGGDADAPPIQYARIQLVGPDDD